MTNQSNTELDKLGTGACLNWFSLHLGNGEKFKPSSTEVAAPRGMWIDEKRSCSSSACAFFTGSWLAGGASEAKSPESYEHNEKHGQKQIKGWVRRGRWQWCMEAKQSKHGSKWAAQASSTVYCPAVHYYCYYYCCCSSSSVDSSPLPQWDPVHQQQWTSVMRKSCFHLTGMERR